ncbi:MAG: hypothetical protein IKZ58_10515 [Selenomonadaceae bacterium]|nr:hypothetical protein [Selenomonadaceae bacterium]
MSSCKLRLYGKVLQTENIVKAIEEVKRHSGSKTSGPDGISKETNIPIERIIREVKSRLRKRTPVRSRTIEIPKGNGKDRTLTVINYFDRIAQQAVKRVISPILEPKQSKYSYGFREGIGTKIAASKVANYIMNFDVHSVEIDIKSCFNSIKLDIALDMLREMGITDGKLLSTIKHLMYVSKDYQGVGLGQGTILGPLLCNCVLHKLDTFMEENFELENRSVNYTKEYQRHKGEWIKWHEETGRKLRIRYVRFADDTFIACRNSEEPEYVKEKVKRFIEEVLELKVNEDKTKLRTNGFEYLGYRFYKSDNGKKNVWIRMKDEKEYIKELGRFNFRSNKNFYDFLKWFRGVIYYFDICNDMSKFLNKVTTRLYTRSTKRNNVLKRESSSVYSIKDGREKVEIDVYEWRKRSRTSFKEYLVNNFGLKSVKRLKRFHLKTNTESTPICFTRDRGIFLKSRVNV